MHYLNKEQKLISDIKDLLGASGKYIGDDCAVLPASSGKILATTDTLVEHIHFRLEWTTLENLGWKSLAVNLSDIAAMAGKPQYALVSLSAPEDFYTSNKALPFYEGLKACANRYATSIVGGDITRGPSLAITITLIGQAHEAGLLMRSGAMPGDVILVTGDFGASTVGLQLLLNDDDAQGKQSSQDKAKHCFEHFLHPLPKLQESWQLAERTGSNGALMDTSDGLADALLQISSASNVGMQIDLNKIPIHQDTVDFAHKKGIDPTEIALYGGEDYELVACLPENIWLNWQKDKPQITDTFKQIGTVTDVNDIQLTMGNEAAYKLDPERIFKHIS